jgi:hypothetical protein
MGALDTALALEVRRLREVAEAQLVTQRETNRLLYALATGQNPDQVAPAPVERVAPQAKKDRKGLLSPRY